AANSRAVARPTPVPPPATRATLPSSAPTSSPRRAALVGIARAEGPHRAVPALRRAGRAPRGAEVHERLVVVVATARWHQGLAEVPHGLLALERGEAIGAEKDAAEHAAHVGVDPRRVAPVGERADGARRVAADPAHLAERGVVVGQNAAVAGDGFA